MQREEARLNLKFKVWSMLPDLWRQESLFQGLKNRVQCARYLTRRFYFLTMCSVRHYCLSIEDVFSEHHVSLYEMGKNSFHYFTSFLRSKLALSSLHFLFGLHLRNALFPTLIRSDYSYSVSYNQPKSPNLTLLLYMKTIYEPSLYQPLSMTIA